MRRINQNRDPSVGTYLVLPEKHQVVKDVWSLRVQRMRSRI